MPNDDRENLGPVKLIEWTQLNGIEQLEMPIHIPPDNRPVAVVAAERVIECVKGSNPPNLPLVVLKIV